MSSHRHQTTGRPIQLHQSLAERMGEVSKHPAFMDAVLQTARAHFESSVALRLDPGRPLTYRMVLFETYLLFRHFDCELFGRGQGANFVELQAFATKLGICGSRTVSNAVRRMIDCGRLQQVVDPCDSRVRRLLPTDAFLTAHCRISNCYMLGLSLLGMVRGDVREFRGEDQLFQYFRYHVGKAYSEGLDPVRPFGVPNPFLSTRSGGVDIFCYLLVENHHAFGASVGDVPFAINISYVADALNTSRSHVRNVLNGLAERGLVQYEQYHSYVTLSTQLLRSHQLASACVFLLYERAFRAASDDIADLATLSA